LNSSFENGKKLQLITIEVNNMSQFDTTITRMARTFLLTKVNRVMHFFNFKKNLILYFLFVLGISLTVEQWLAFKEVVPAIENAVEEMKLRV
jgi:hypothetical protein